MFSILAIHNTPIDRAHFDEYYPRVHIPLVWALPGVTDVQYGHVEPSPDDPGAPFLVCNVLFPDRATYEAAATSPQMADAIADVPKFSTGGVQLLTVDLDCFPGAA